MGYGGYSESAHRALTEERAKLGVAEVFRENACHPSMNPKGVRFRESRDSEAHPASVGIVFALDVSGSMGAIPHKLATETLPHFMAGVVPILPDAQVLFMALGNAYSDASPIQLGQFESEATLIDQWLSRIHVEGQGGGWGESYDLAMLLASRHTAMDCLERRGKKGYFFMTGDETPFIESAPDKVANYVGDALEKPLFIVDLTRELQEKFVTFFLIPDPARAAIENVRDVWTTLLRERCLVLATPDDTAVVCAACIAIEEGIVRDVGGLRAFLSERIGRSGDELERVVTTLDAYLSKRAAGTIEGPGMLYRRTDVPNRAG